MFDLNDGYYMYHNEDEFVEKVDAVLNKNAASPCVCKEVVEKFNWNTVAKIHNDYFRNSQIKK